jgi:hypothetical protein
MGRLRKDYSLYRRRLKDGSKVWYSPPVSAFNLPSC